MFIKKFLRARMFAWEDHNVINILHHHHLSIIFICLKTFEFITKSCNKKHKYSVKLEILRLITNYLLLLNYTVSFLTTFVYCLPSFLGNSKLLQFYKLLLFYLCIGIFLKGLALVVCLLFFIYCNFEIVCSNLWTV